MNQGLAKQRRSFGHEKYTFHRKYPPILHLLLADPSRCICNTQHDKRDKDGTEAEEHQRVL
jgi:hypothetical protein